MARYGFPGKVYPGNGSAPEVQGLPAYASVKDVPGPVDLALVMVRAELVAGVLRDCAAVGAPLTFSPVLGIDASASEVPGQRGTRR